MGLSRDDILSADDLKREVVKVKEWGGEITVRTMTGSERSAFEEKVASTNGLDQQINMKNFLEKLVVSTAADDEGNLLFTDADVDALSKKSASAILRVARVAQRINGLTAGDVEDLTKN